MLVNGREGGASCLEGLQGPGGWEGCQGERGRCEQACKGHQGQEDVGVLVPRVEAGCQTPRSDVQEKSIPLDCLKP